MRTDKGEGMEKLPQTHQGLPHNAYTELKPGESYIPYIPAEKNLPQVTLYSFLWGTFFAILFSAAAAFLGLKIGQVFEAAIPIAILAVGISLNRKNALLENVIVQSIGSSWSNSRRGNFHDTWFVYIEY